ncbi:MAG: lysophospholipase L1-like esterase [Cryomorphaceae bacterium]|jgi:lysophospholipase L1-like esterase
MLEFCKPKRTEMGLLFLLLLTLVSCGKENETTSESKPIRFSYLALGDSYTIGTALPDSSKSYPIQLVERLNQDASLEGTDPDIVAFGGWRTDQLISAIEIADLSVQYDLVSLLIGVNNQFQNRSDSVYAVEFEELLNTAIGFAGNDTDRVFVLSIPDYGVTPFGQSYSNASAGVDAFNALNLQITTAFGISYFDITAISRQAENDLSLVAPDNLHPSSDMYDLWVNEILDDVKEKLYE